MNRQFKEFITYKSLAIKHGNTVLQDIVEDMGESNVENGVSTGAEIKNVCAKLSKELSDDIDSTVAFLDIRKRRFIELAIIQALDDAKAIIEEVVSSDEDWIQSQGGSK